jgi:hypothetical protein
VRKVLGHIELQMVNIMLPGMILTLLAPGVEPLVAGIILPGSYLALLTAGVILLIYYCLGYAIED